MTNAEASDNLTRRRAGLVLLLICTIGLVLRVYHVLTAVAVSPDSGLLIEYAQRLGEDPLGALRSYAQHPLYPVLIWLFHGPTGWFGGEGPTSWIVAGQLVAIVGSLGAILALYWFTARLYDRTRGLIAAGMLAVLPDACRFAADVLTDLPHLVFYLIGLAALLTGMQTERWRYLLIGAATAALAFLTRPEGGAVLLIGVVVIVLHGRWPVRRRLGLAAAMVAVFFCFAGPYQLATGRLIQKKSLLELLKFGFAARIETPAAAPRVSERFSGQPKPIALGPELATTLPVPINVLRQWVRAGRVVYILLAIVGLVVARPGGAGGRILAAAIGIHLLLMHALEYRHGYLDRRHALILATLSLPLAAAGVWWLAGKLGTRATGVNQSHRPWAVVAIIAVCVLLTSPWLLRPINAADAHVVASGRWLARHSAPGELIVGDNRLRRVALYAGRPFAEWPWWDGQVDHLADFLKDKPAGYFVVDVRHMTLSERNPAFFEDLEQRLDDRLELLHREPGPPYAEPTEIRVYRIHAGTAPGGADWHR